MVVFGETNNIRIRIRSFFGTRIIFVFVFGPQNTIRSPLNQVQTGQVRHGRSMIHEKVPEGARDPNHLTWPQCGAVGKVFGQKWAASISTIVQMIRGSCGPAD